MNGSCQVLVGPPFGPMYLLSKSKRRINYHPKNPSTVLFGLAVPTAEGQLMLDASGAFTSTRYHQEEEEEEQQHKQRRKEPHRNRE